MRARLTVATFLYFPNTAGARAPPQPFPNMAGDERKKIEKLTEELMEARENAAQYKADSMAKQILVEEASMSISMNTNTNMSMNTTHVHETCATCTGARVGQVDPKIRCKPRRTLGFSDFSAQKIRKRPASADERAPRSLI